MKKNFGLLSMMLCLATLANAQNVSANKVPAKVKSAFTTRHPGIKVKWEMEDKNYEAGFDVKGKNASEVYAMNGTLLETEVQIKTSELPAAVQAKLKGMKIAEAAKITKADGTVIYEAQVKGKDLLFDAKGNPVKPN